MRKIIKSIIKESILKEGVKEDTYTKFNKIEALGKKTYEYYYNEFERLKKLYPLKTFQDANTILKLNISQPNNLPTYQTFKQMESMVDYIKSTTQKAEKIEVNPDWDIEIKGGKVIYKDKDLIISQSVSREACIKYGTGYGWCISRSEGSMFGSYRYKDELKPTFYFVKDIQRTKKELGIFGNVAKSVKSKTGFDDKYHFFVIQVPFNVKVNDIYYEQYIVTSSNNDGDDLMSWEQIVNIQPKLKGKQELFVPIDYSKDEKTILKKFKDLTATDEQFIKLSRDEKEKYLEINVETFGDLTYNMFISLPEDLQKQYIGMGLGFDDDMMKYIKSKPELEKYRKKVVKVLEEKIDSEEITFASIYRMFDRDEQNRNIKTVFDAINMDNFDKAREIIKNNSDPFTINPLVVAIDKNQNDIVRDLLKDSRIDPSKDNQLALALAVGNNNAEVVEMLLNHKKVTPYPFSHNPDFIFQSGYVNGSKDALKVLIDHITNKKDIRYKLSYDFYKDYAYS